MPFTSKQKFNPVPVGEVFIKTIVEEVDGNSIRVVRGLRSQQAFELEFLGGNLGCAQHVNVLM